MVSSAAALQTVLVRVILPTAQEQRYELPSEWIDISEQGHSLLIYPVFYLKPKSLVQENAVLFQGCLEPRVSHIVELPRVFGTWHRNIT